MPLLAKSVMRAKRIFAAIALVLVQAWPASAASGELPLQKREINEKTKTYTIEFAYPRTGHAAIDRAIETWARDLAQTFAKDARETEIEAERPWASGLSYEIGRNDGRMFAVLFSNYTYTGGAHPNSHFEAFNFLLPGGERVELAELITRRGIERVSAMSIAQLKQKLGEPDGMSDTDWIARGAGPNAKNFRNFILKPNELVVHFDAYQVAAYAAGPQETHIPLSRLKDVMRPDPLAPAASFDCTKAASDVEQQLCASREIARLDRHLAEDYAEKLMWAQDDAARAKLKQEQRAWLQHRDDYCRRVRMAPSACLTREYQKRLQALNPAP